MHFTVPILEDSFEMLRFLRRDINQQAKPSPGSISFSPALLGSGLHVQDENSRPYFYSSLKCLPRKRKEI